MTKSSKNLVPATFVPEVGEIYRIKGNYGRGNSSVPFYTINDRLSGDFSFLHTGDLVLFLCEEENSHWKGTPYACKWWKVFDLKNLLVGHIMDDTRTIESLSKDLA